MVTVEYRPKRFSEVFHQEVPKKVLQAIARKPDETPHSILLSGHFGSGKTTLARIFAAAVNCSRKEAEPCWVCPSCVEIETSGSYVEYDSSIVGNVATLRSLRDTFGYSFSSGYRVVVFDEIQASSKEAQSTLLRITEEAPINTFFLMATTDPGQLLPALRSRFLELEFELAPLDVLRSRVEYLALKHNVKVSDTVRDSICFKSAGHFRTLDMTFDLFLILGEEFENSIRSNVDTFARFVAFAHQANRDGCTALLKDLLKSSVVSLKVDFEMFLVSIVQAFSDQTHRYATLSKALGAGVFALFKYCASPWGVGAFTSDRMFVAYMWSLFYLVQSLKQAGRK